ncbi:MAG: MDR family oxidoreductase [Ktedonobacteraceae bacterium]
MVQESFRALVVEQNGDKVDAVFQELPVTALPQGDVLVSVAYSSLNYKDALAITNQGRIIRNFPFVPGIDLAGTVVESQSASFKAGDQVVLTGWGVGERHWGGYAQLARVKSEWLVPLPQGLSLKDAMGVGTAGFTAMLCVMALEEHGLRPRGRDVLVTGAAGGVGSVAVALLATLGYRVVAATGRSELHDYLKELGAADFLSREALATASKRPLESERWGGAVDAVGGETLASVLKSMAYGTSVAACGLAGGNGLPTTVLPFILRGVNLLGVDSVNCPKERRVQAWGRLAQTLPLDKLEKVIQVVPLQEIPALSREILQGHVRGRVVVDVH